MCSYEARNCIDSAPTPKPWSIYQTVNIDIRTSRRPWADGMLPNTVEKAHFCDGYAADVRRRRQRVATRQIRNANNIMKWIKHDLNWLECLNARDLLLPALKLGRFVTVEVSQQRVNCGLFPKNISIGLLTWKLSLWAFLMFFLRNPDTLPSGFQIMRWNKQRWTFTHFASSAVAEAFTWLIGQWQIYQTNPNIALHVHVHCSVD